MRNILLALLICFCAINVEATEKEIQKWIEALSKGSKEMRMQASSELAQKGEEAVPALIQALSDKNWMVRYYSAFTLSKMGKSARGAIPALTERLEDSDLRVRCHSANALAGMGEAAESAIPSLLKGMEETDWRIRCYFANALGKIGKKSSTAYSALEKALRDSSPYVQKVAVEGLGNLGQASAVKPLLEIYEKSSDSLKVTILEALLNLNAKESLPFLLNFLASSNTEMRDFAHASLLKKQGLFLVPLEKMIEEESEEISLRISAMEVLALYLPPKKQSIYTLLKTTQHSNLDLRSAAKNAMEKIGPAALPFMVEALEEKEISLKTAAHETLQKWGKSAYHHILKESFQRADFEKKGVSYLKSQGIKILPDLMKALSDPDGKWRAFAVEILSQINPPNPLVLQALKKALEDKDKEVQTKAKESLEKIKPLVSPGQQKEIEAWLKGEKTPHK